MAGIAAAKEDGAAVGVAGIGLSLLGDFGVTIDGDERRDVVPARAPSLLAYLVLRAGVPQPRQRIAQTLWPESTDGQARTNLRNVLHHLRRAAPRVAELLRIDPNALSWVGGPHCRVDLVEFQTALDAADSAAAGSPRQREALREAVRWYQGDLLADCPDEWLVDERARLRERLLAALRDLVALLSTADPASAEEAAAYGRELVRQDPLNEAHHRLLIEAYRAIGDRARAVRAYHDCVTLLRQELGVLPSEATQDAYTRLLADTADRTETVDTSVTAPFVGRAREIAELTQRWRDTATSGATLVLVTGEPGIGKTRLVEELAARCARDGALVVSARCYAGEGELGYGPVIEWLRAPELAATLRRSSVADRRYLMRLLPELAPDGVAVGPPGAREMDRRLLFDAVVRVLTSAGRPMLLVLDDAHWCDRPSLHLVHYLVRSGRGRRVLVLATARREEIDDQHPLMAVSQPLTALDMATEVTLHRLTIEETAALSSSLTSTDLDESARRLLYAQTEGNPLFVVEAIRAGWTGSGAVGLTPKLQSVIAGRLRRLSDGARELVAVAATIGRAFTADLLGRASGRDDLAVVRGLDELWRRGVIVNRGVHEYDFSHGRLRDVAYESLTPVARQGWHLSVARALVESSSLDTGSASGQIAAHFDRAGSVTEAIDWYERAAAQAILRSAHAEAYALLRRGIVLARGLPDALGAPAELRLLAMTPPALAGVDGYASDRLAGYERRARSVAARLGVELPAPLLRSSVMDSLCRDEFDRAAQAAQRLLAAAQRSGDRGLAIESRYLMGIVAFWSGGLTTAAARFREVVEQVDVDGRSAHLIRFGQDPQVVCLSRLANTLFFLGDVAAARSTVEEALALADRVGDRYTSDVACIFASLLAADLGDMAMMARVVETFRRRRRRGLLLLKSEALLGYVDVARGDAAAGIERIEAAIRRCGPRNPAPGFVPTLHRLLVGAHDLAGDAAGALAAADRTLALGGTRLWESEVRRIRRRARESLGTAPRATTRKRPANAASSRLPA